MEKRKKVLNFLYSAGTRNLYSLVQNVFRRCFHKQLWLKYIDDFFCYQAPTPFRIYSRCASVIDVRLAMTMKQKTGSKLLRTTLQHTLERTLQHTTTHGNTLQNTVTEGAGLLQTVTM